LGHSSRDWLSLSQLNCASQYWVLFAAECDSSDGPHLASVVSAEVGIDSASPPLVIEAASNSMHSFFDSTNQIARSPLVRRPDNHRIFAEMVSP